jgi:hypothetical protein
MGIRSRSEELRSVATRVDGIVIVVPSSVRFTQEAPPDGAPHLVAGLGRLEGLRVLDEHRLTFAFVAETESGERLARQLRTGRARLEVALPEEPVVGRLYRELRLRIVWEDTEDVVRGHV